MDEKTQILNSIAATITGNFTSNMNWMTYSADPLSWRAGAENPTLVEAPNLFACILLILRFGCTVPFFAIEKLFARWRAS